MTRKSIIPKDEYQSYKNDFDKEILNKKTTTETINITSSTSDLLVTYALIYSNLTDQGKKEARNQLEVIGLKYDYMKKSIENDIVKLEKTINPNDKPDHGFNFPFKGRL